VVVSLITAAVALLSLRGLMALLMQTVTGSVVPFWRNSKDYTSNIQEVARNNDIEIGIS
jgi:hypothetical protein